MERLIGERRHYTTYDVSAAPDGYIEVEYEMDPADALFDRYVDKAPFVPGRKEEREKRCEEILAIQSMGRKNVWNIPHCRSVVIGISGGLDSTLALLVAARTVDRLNLPRTCITAVTMPCFGTTDRTYNNACELTRRLGANLREVDIKEAVNIHFRDIGHDSSVHDVTYENSQARERTQILMDIANQTSAWSSVPVICPSWHWAGLPTMEITCPCMVSMYLCQRRWCCIWFATMRIPVEMRS